MSFPNIEDLLRIFQRNVAKVIKSMRKLNQNDLGIETTLANCANEAFVL